MIITWFFQISFVENYTIAGEKPVHHENFTPLYQKVTNFWRKKIGSGNFLWNTVSIHSKLPEIVEWVITYITYWNNIFTPIHFLPMLIHYVDPRMFPDFWQTIVHNSRTVNDRGLIEHILKTTEEGAKCVILFCCF